MFGYSRVTKHTPGDAVSYVRIADPTKKWCLIKASVQIGLNADKSPKREKQIRVHKCKSYRDMNEYFTLGATEHVGGD